MAELIVHNTEWVETKLPANREWGLEGPGPSTPCTERGVKADPNVVPFRTTKLVAYTHFLSNVMRSKRLLSHLISTLPAYNLFFRRPNHHSSHN